MMFCILFIYDILVLFTVVWVGIFFCWCGFFGFVCLGFFIC